MTSTLPSNGYLSLIIEMGITWDALAPEKKGEIRKNFLEAGSSIFMPIGRDFSGISKCFHIASKFIFNNSNDDRVGKALEGVEAFMEVPSSDEMEKSEMLTAVALYYLLERIMKDIQKEVPHKANEMEIIKRIHSKLDSKEWLIGEPMMNNLKIRKLDNKDSLKVRERLNKNGGK